MSVTGVEVSETPTKWEGKAGTDAGGSAANRPEIEKQEVLQFQATPIISS